MPRTFRRASVTLHDGCALTDVEVRVHGRLALIVEGSTVTYEMAVVRVHATGRGTFQVTGEDRSTWLITARQGRRTR